MQDIERDLLRAFYKSWRDFHEIPRTDFNKRRIQEAAQHLVDAANAVKTYDEPCIAKLNA